MAEKTGTSALAAYKAGIKEAKAAKAKKKYVKYFPIGRSLGVGAGVLTLIDAKEVENAMTNLFDWNLKGFADRLGRAFDTSKDQKLKAGKIIASSVILGKALDAAKVNPKVKFAGYGIKLV